MIVKTEIEKFIVLIDKMPVIDVRSPAEFNQGHIPHAFNFPVFDDDERTEVGLLYTKTSPEHAMIRGIDIALDKMDSWQHRIKSEFIHKNILIYCWRGGMRSAAMAEVFNHAGFEVRLLKGGYKSWRRYIREELENPRRIVVIGGYTGSGKTALLQTLSDFGEQFIDLEKLACHKGSVFGALGQNPQPTNEQFENELFALLSQLDPKKNIWIEDESRMIGNVTLPEPLFRKISSSPLIFIQMERQIRLENIIREYAGFDKSLLASALRKIGQRIGGDKLKSALTALKISDFQKVADITLAYYDKSYLHALEQRKTEIYPVKISGTDPESDAETIIKFSNLLSK